MQVLESYLQNFLAQKQAVQIELNEVDNALGELKDSDEEVDKVISGIMLKSSKEKLSKDLSEKKKTMEMKIDSLEKQEKLLDKNASDLRMEVNKAVSKE